MDLLLLGGLTATAAALWNQIKTVWFQLQSVILVTFVIQFEGVEAFLVYLGENAKKINIGPALYHGRWMAVRNTTRQQIVAWEVMNKVGGLYILDRKPIWISAAGKEYNEGHTSYDAHPSSITITYLRGMFDRRRLISEACSFLSHMIERENTKRLFRNRHFVRRVTGISSKQVMGMTKIDRGDSSGPLISSSWDSRAYRSATPINYLRSEIGPSNNSLTLDEISLSSDAEHVLSEVRQWYSMEDWYKARRIPWKFGVLFHGDPGGGKTATARALAEELDVPIYMFDLASLDNQELQSEWKQMLSSVPCIALLEDIDTVFDGRTNLVNKDLTFDCLLNCIDGIERSDGLLVIITTNNILRVDPALGRESDNIPSNGSRMASRPGRIDRIVHMPTLSKIGREKIATRILSGLDNISWVVAEGKNDTGAQFQDRCVRRALQLLKENPTWQESQ